MPNFFNNSFQMYRDTKPYHNMNLGVTDLMINLKNRLVNFENSEKLKDLGFPQNSLFYHTHSKFGLLYRMSIDFSGNPISAFDLFEIMQFIPIGSYLMERFHGRFSSRGISGLLDVNNVAKFIIEYYQSNPEYFSFDKK